MKSYIAFTKKEFTEYFRSSKMVLMIIVFLILGLMSPLLAKFTPEILKSLASDGLSIKVAAPTAIDSWTQYYKNMSQFGLIVLVILFSGILTNEISKGTLINMLTKGLKRSTVILAKMTMASISWTIAYLVAFFITYGYTIYFWPKDSLDNLFLAAACLWLFGLFLIASIMLGSVVFKGIGGSLLFTGGLVALMFILDIFPKLSKYNPIRLVSSNLNLITGSLNFDDILKPVITVLIMVALFIFSSCLIFNKKIL